MSMLGFVRSRGYLAGKNLLKNKSFNVTRRWAHTDRTFRLCNLSDLRACQSFLHKLDAGGAHYFGRYSITADVTNRDLERQVVLDLSHEQGYRRGHIPGAVNLSVGKFDFTRNIDIYGGILQEDVVDAMAACGVNNDTSEIILYDNSGLLACRLWYVLRYFGFRNVRILNGGWRGYLKANLPIEETSPEVTVSKPTNLKPKRTSLLTKPSQMVMALENKNATLVDARRPEAYKRYHIPNAKNVPSSVFMEDAQFRSLDEIRSSIEKHGLSTESDHKSIVYSENSLSASVVLFALQMGGIDNSSLYDMGIGNYRKVFDDRLTMDQIDHLSR